MNAKEKEDFLFGKYFYQTEYDSLFLGATKSRGSSYYFQGRVVHFKQNGDVYEAEVVGTKTYQVMVKIKDHILIEKSCTCPYHQDTNPYCKHIYALLFSIKIKQLYPQFLEAIESEKEKIQNGLYEMKNLRKKNKTFLAPYQLDWYQKRVKKYEEVLKEKKLEEVEEYQLPFYGRTLWEMAYSIENDIFTLKNDIVEGKKYREERAKEESHITTYHFSDGFDIPDQMLEPPTPPKKEKSGFWRELLFGVLLGASSNSKKEKEKNDDFLMPWEKEEVKKGNYDSWNFEEEDLEEDDYYYEDRD